MGMSVNPGCMVPVAMLMNEVSSLQQIAIAEHFRRRPIDNDLTCVKHAAPVRDVAEIAEVVGRGDKRFSYPLPTPQAGR